MIKRPPIMMTVLFTASVLLSSCYSYTSVVGEGAKADTEKVKGENKKTKWNHYAIGGLIRIKASDSKEMVNELGGAEDYNVRTRHTILNGLVGLVTFGLYTPTTTTVTK